MWHCECARLPHLMGDAGMIRTRIDKIPRNVPYEIESISDTPIMDVFPYFNEKEENL